MPRMNRSRQQRRRLPAWTSVALVLLVATTSTPSSTRTSVEAFVLPQPRVRNAGAMAVVRTATEDSNKRASLEKKDEENNKNQKCNGKEVRNGATQPTDLASILEEKEVEDTFEIHVGRALDTLKKDYPHMLTDRPDFSIFDKEIEVIDPSGVKLHGLKNYKGAFRLVHAIVQVFYCPERSGLTFRMCYDTARQNIRVSWNAEVIPKAIFGGVRTTLHVDGISVYEIHHSTGMITQHRIERLVMNDTPVSPQQGIFAWLRNEHEESVPVFNGPVYHGVEQQQPTNALEFRPQSKSSLFDDEEDSSTALKAVEDGSDNNNPDSYPGMDWEAFERKNASRKKFGVEPLTPEEFLENEQIVQQMESQQRQRAASASAAAEMTKKAQTKQQGFLERLFGNVGPDACESNFDCVRPEICCDFGFKKICCASGTMVGNQKLERAYVPVPADMNNYPGQEFPRNF